MKRTPLTRKTPMPRMKASSKATVRKQRALILYKDSHGLTLDNCNKLLRPAVSEWPFIEDVDDLAVLRQFRSDRCLSVPQACWLCGKKRYLDACHIVPRSDERSNLVAFCSCLPQHGYSDSCHALTEKNWAMLAEVLKAKWTHDRDHTSWLAIAIRRRQRFLFTSLD